MNRRGFIGVLAGLAACFSVAPKKSASLAGEGLTGSQPCEVTVGNPLHPNVQFVGVDGTVTMLCCTTTVPNVSGQWVLPTRSVTFNRGLWQA